MTVAVAPIHVSYTGNGSTTAFAFAGTFIDPGDLTVELIDADGTISAGLLNGVGGTGYTVTGTLDQASGEYRSGGTITFNTAPAAGVTVFIARLVQLTQTLDLQRGAKFPAESINTAFDRAMMIAQQLQDGIDRAITYPIEGGKYDAHGIAIGNVGTPTLPEDAATKSYIDNGGWLGAIAGNQFVNGIYIDTRGTGTADDTAIWTQAIADAASLGYNRIYARRPSYVKNLTIASPVEIIGAPGFAFNLAATATTTDVCLQISADSARLKGITVNLPVYRGIAAGSTPAGRTGILIRNGINSETSIKQRNIYLEDVTVIGGNNAGIDVVHCDRFTAVNVEVRQQAGFGMVLGRSAPVTKVRINGFRAVSCGSYGLTLSQFSGTPPDVIGDSDIELWAVQLIMCGKFARLTGFDGGVKFGADLTGNSISRLVGQIFCWGCQSGGVEIKYTTAAPVGYAIPQVMEDFDLYVYTVQDNSLLSDSGIWVGLSPTGTSDLAATVMRRIRLRGACMFRGPGTWGAARPYEIGAVIDNGGNSYMCWGDANGAVGISGNAGAPTGTGTGALCYFDGNLYWEYIGVTPDVTFKGMQIDTLGGSGLGITIDGYEVASCAYHCLLRNDGGIGHNPTGFTFINPIARNCINGIVDNGASSSTTPGTLTDLHIIQPDFDITTGYAIKLGFVGNGSTTGDSVVSGARLVGGRIRATTGYCIRLEQQVDLTISGDCHLSSNSGIPMYVANGAGHTLTVSDATLVTETNGHYCLQSGGSTGTVTILGQCRLIQHDTTLAGYSLSGWTVLGQFSRGPITSTPQGNRAGALGEAFYLSPPTTTVARYDCTTAGSQAGAVWTAKA